MDFVYLNTWRRLSRLWDSSDKIAPYILFFYESSVQGYLFVAEVKTYYMHLVMSPIYYYQNYKFVQNCGVLLLLHKTIVLTEIWLWLLLYGIFRLGVALVFAVRIPSLVILHLTEFVVTFRRFSTRVWNIRRQIHKNLAASVGFLNRINMQFFVLSGKKNMFLRFQATVWLYYPGSILNLLPHKTYR